MISIKKVSVTPLPENTTGEIIDSFDTTDDKHTNAPSINASKNYIDSKASTAQSNAVNTARTYTDSKVSAVQNSITALSNDVETLRQNSFKVSDYAIIENILTIASGQQSGSATISYPAGFNRNNCMVVSIMGERNDNQAGYSTPASPSVMSLARGNMDLVAQLSDNIIITARYTTNMTQDIGIKYKLMLLKLI